MLKGNSKIQKINLDTVSAAGIGDMTSTIEIILIKNEEADLGHFNTYLIAVFLFLTKDKQGARLERILKKSSKKR